MDEQTVRDHAQRHADATVAGDLKTAGSDLTPEAMQQAGAVMPLMPKPLSGASIESVEIAGDKAVVMIEYRGDGDAATVESTWQESEGRPKIVGLRVP